MAVPSRADELLKAFAAYRAARLKFLHQIGRPTSNRDPLAEFSECLVALLLGGTLAGSPVQKDYDVIGPDGQRIQVKYLANPRGYWVNEHHVQFHGEMDAYAIVLFEELEPTHVIVFQREGLEEVGRRLGKRHSNQSSSLRLTRRNVHTILENTSEFEQLRVKVITLRELRAKPQHAYHE